MLVVEVPDNLVTSTVPNIQMPKEEAEQLASASEEGDPFPIDASLESSSSPKWSKITNDAGDRVKVVRLDISFKSPNHTGLQTTGLVIIYRESCYNIGSCMYLHHGMLHSCSYVSIFKSASAYKFFGHGSVKYRRCTCLVCGSDITDFLSG